MTMALVKTRLCAIVLLILVVSSVGRQEQQASHRTTEETLENVDHDIHGAHRHLAADPKLKERYESYPAGFRIHPSYLSDSYLTRAREMTTAEKKELENEWGSWTLTDDKRATRPGDDFYVKYTNRDVPDFPANAWQKDTEYLSKFLKEATDLTKRGLEAILAEYGKVPANANDPDADFQERSRWLRAELPDLEEGAGRNLVQKDQNFAKGGWIAKKSWEGLKRRLLHAIMTEDSFNLVMGGHSAAAGHGNHFEQTYTMQYGRIMEPIFARLGVKGTARNVGMGGMGTIQNSIGAGPIYGMDTDILVWDSAMTEKKSPDHGIFASQGILGGNRAPFMWFEKGSILQRMHRETGADVGVFGSGRDVPVGANTFQELDQQPWASRYMNCAGEVRAECRQKRNQYNGTCWIKRDAFHWREGIDIELEGYTPWTEQKAEPGGRASWHPGNRVHQLKGRVLAFNVLYALHEALTEWKERPNYQLPNEAWHVSAYYKDIRDKVAESPVTDNFCTQKNLPLPVCRVPISARSENTPRARPWETSIRNIMKGQGVVPEPLPSVYDPPDVYNPILDPPPGEIDVLAIVENGIDYEPNLARIQDSQERQLPTGQVEGKPKNPAIEFGRGLTLEVPVGHCDGMYDSHCKKDASQKCFLYGHNDGRGEILFDGFSGWMVFQIPKIEHGLLMLGIYDWIYTGNPATEGWCSENDKEPCTSRNLRAGQGDATVDEDASSFTPEDEEREYRRLKPKVPPYCDDFKFEIAINGEMKSFDLKTWTEDMRLEVSRVMKVWPIMEDPNFKGSNVEVAIRMTGCGNQKPYGLTHVYWA